VARPDRPQHAYLDACCYIDWAEGKLSSPAVETWLLAARRRQVRIIASTVMFAEARGHSNGPHDSEAEQTIRTLLQEPYVTLVDVTRRIGLLARDISIERTRVKGMDAVHMATAVYAEADVFLSRDLKAFTVSEKYKGVWVDEPYEYGGEGLFPIPRA
jgi:predicted nucleic acid-binding protein